MEKKKVYVVCEYTLQELQDEAKTVTDYWGSKDLYEHKVSRSGFTQEQKEIQLSNRWNTEYLNNIRISETKLYDRVKKIFYEELNNGCRENIKDKLIDSLMDTKVKSTASFNKYKDNDNKIYTGLSYDYELEGEESEDSEYINDVKEFESKLKDVSRRSYSYSRNDDIVYLETFKVQIHAQDFRDIKDTVTRIVNKFLRNELTYCINSNKIIVPEEYIAKGEVGINEWRELKRSKNKNNNIENQIIKQTFKEKKKFAVKSMYAVMGAITKNNWESWKVPNLSMDGGYNTQRTSYLVNQLLKDKDKKQFLSMPEEEIIERFKKHWIDKLNKSIKQINEIKPEDIK